MLLQVHCHSDDVHIVAVPKRGDDNQVSSYFYFISVLDMKMGIGI